MSSLPPNFPESGLSDTDQHRVQWYFRRYVENYYQEYRFGHFILAAYASVPALLTPDLLYKIWQHFNGYRWGNTPVSIHRIAVADLLLSPLCREVGFELYEMHYDIRLAFQEWLKIESANDLWKNRQLRSIETLAAFSSEYNQRPNSGVARWGQGYYDIQRWGAMAYSDHESLQRQLSNRLNAAMSKGNKSEALRIMDIWSKTGEQLDRLYKNDSDKNVGNFQQNGEIAKAWKALIQQNEQAFAEQFEKNPQLRALLNTDAVNGIAVNMPTEVLDKAQGKNRARIYSICVGIDHYEGNIPSLKGCVNDAQAVSGLLKKFVESPQQPTLDDLNILNEQATSGEILKAFDHFRQAMDGDFCFFYFSGHADSQPQDDRGRRLLFHDSRTEQGKDITQGDLEEKIYALLAEKAVHFLWIIDTHEASEEAMKRGLNELPLRKNAQQLKGSLVILNSVLPGQKALETRNREGNTAGLFTTALLEVFSENGTALSYRNLIERVRLRLLQGAHREQTPFLEAFPAGAAGLHFLSDRYDHKISHQIAFDKPAEQWRLHAGARQGITPSLNFMDTYLLLEDKARVVVKDVFPDYSTLLDFRPEDTGRVFNAGIGQLALPKVKIAFDPGLDPGMKRAFEEAVQRYDIYYIILVENPGEAKYFIRNRDREYYLIRSSSTEQPVFTYVGDAFEFIKQLEYIAQWTGVLEYNAASSDIGKEDVEIVLEKIEGQGITPNNFNSLIGETTNRTDLLELRYKKVNNEWAQPAFRCKVLATRKKVFVQALYLDSTYGIMAFAQKELTPSVRTRSTESNNDYANLMEITLSDSIVVNGVPVQIEQEYLNEGITETYDYIKIFISGQKIDIEPFVQASLEFNARVTRSGGFEETKRKVDFAGVEWTSVTIPVKVVQEEETKSGNEPSATAENLKETGSDKANELITMTVIIMTPLMLEFDAVVRHLDNRTSLIKDSVPYERGIFTGKQDKYEVIIPAPGSMGVNMALALEKAIQQFQPQIVLLVGIAGGVKDVRIGDVLVANKVYGYESVKEDADGYSSRPAVESSSADLLACAQALSRKPDWKKRTADQAPEARIFIGPIVASDKVEASIFRQIQQQFNDTLGVEMEASGFTKALQNHRDIHQLAICGISDLLESKSATDRQNWQLLAAERAAAVCFELLFEFDASNFISPPKPHSFYPDKNIIRQMITGNKIRMTDVAWHSLLVNLSKAVCRISNKDGNLGTGFLLKDGYLLTANHVIKDAGAADEATIEMNYEKDMNGVMKQSVVYRLDGKSGVYCPPDQLNFSYIKVIDQPDNPLSQWGFLEIENEKLPVKEEPAVLIHHPRGQWKCISFDNEGVLNDMTSENKIFYKNDTEGGSSGAPVLNSLLHVVAVHTGRQPDTQAKSKAIYSSNTADSENTNFGTSIKAIMEFIAASGKEESQTAA